MGQVASGACTWAPVAFAFIEYLKTSQGKICFSCEIFLSLLNLFAHTRMNFVKSIIDKLHVYRPVAMLHEIFLSAICMWANAGTR